ncbi:unnamed protein product [Rhizophagus irregularis]|uniref:Uncharacterized protein n=1 Tax=Rhizophagus irregularis TaxID=588596 RepID=A0A2N1N989_9GLOM|nr:hypothetical protein RhiirC2_779657 [Rhizophagus irregularis]CAB4379425.1 unnamed protein product [Rhizophagus irregularis]CAB5375650.1 unnamed protein product [Rhizophagus irregularis]
MEPPPLHIPDNNEYPESINNIYSIEFSQPVTDKSQNNPCNCNSCLSLYVNNNNNTFTTNNFNTVANPPLIQQFINDANERSSPIFIPKEEQRIIGNEQQLQPIPDISTDTTVNYTELFKIEISGGVEIVVRKKSLQNLNYHNSETQQQQQHQHQQHQHQQHQHQHQHQQITSNLTNRVGRIQNRMHPYQMPNNSCPRTYADLTPQINQQGNISDINQNYVNQ